MGHDCKVRVPCLNEVIFRHLPLLKEKSHKIFSGSSTSHPELEQSTSQSEVLRSTRSVLQHYLSSANY